MSSEPNRHITIPDPTENAAPEVEVARTDRRGPNAGSLKLHRPARALLGWMTHEEALTTQAGRLVGITDDSHAARAKAARDAVSRRARRLDPPCCDEDPPGELASHIAALASDQGASQMLNDGWVPRVVDLPTVRAFQPIVFEDDAPDRVDNVDAGDMAAIARLTLPIGAKEPVPGAFNPERQAFVFTSANPNLRVQGQFQGEVAPGVFGFGFVVGLSPSFMQVACFDDRRFLRDGYHRAYGLLRRGITRVPVLMKEFGSVEELALPPGMLPQAAWLGHNPPRLADYLDDDVSVRVRLPVTQQIILVQAVALTSVG